MAMTTPDMNTEQPTLSQPQPQNDLSFLDYGHLKDGKLAYRETKLRPETHKYAANNIIAFRSCRQTAENLASLRQTQEIGDIPEEFTPMITMLVQDSDETLPVLANRLNEILSPFNRNEQVSEAYLGALERKIRSVANRRKYGLDLSTNQLEGTATYVPSHLVISRWEATDITLLPADFQEILCERRQLRQQMSEQLTELYHSLPAHLQQYMLSTKHRKANVPYEEKVKTLEDLTVEIEQRRIKHKEKQKREEERLEEKRKREEERLEEKRKREEEKMEEKRKREEEKMEEKRKREEEKMEEKRKRDEDRKKKEQSQLRLTSLFTKNAEGKGTSPMINEHIVESKSMFPPFFVKDHVNMFMVESIRETKSDLLNILTSYSINPDIIPQESNQLRKIYLEELDGKEPLLTQPRCIKRKVDLKQLLLPGCSGSNLDSIHRPENKSLLKMKLLQFTENVRPAYYGTWTKSSRNITPKNPFTKDNELVDYDYDSEAEWEPEGEGEDIQSGDEDEDDVAPEAIDPEDIGWLVPEGYLSEGEGVNDSDDDGMTKIVQRLSVRPKSRKNVAVRPIVIGPIFENENDMDYNEPLKPFGIRMLIDSCETNGYDPFALIEKKSNTTDCSTTATHTDHPNKAIKFNEEHTAALINIVNGKVDGINKLVVEAKANPLLCDFPKTKLEAKIKDVAIKEKRGTDTKSAWYIKNGQDPTLLHKDSTL